MYKRQEIDVSYCNVSVLKAFFYSKFFRGVAPPLADVSVGDGFLATFRASSAFWLLSPTLCFYSVFNFLSGDEEAASTLLHEAEQLAIESGLRANLADVLLTRARLFRDRRALESAGKLIDELSYLRRAVEFSDAEQSI